MIKSNTFKIALIGAGQLGSRYLQGIASSDLDAELYIVDPSIEAINICYERILEVNPSYNFDKITNLESVDNLPLKLDLVVVATTANVRWKVISDLLDCDRKVTYAILEKVLFQRENEYAECEALLKLKSVRAWVNCPRRLLPIYKELQNVVSGKLREVFVTGGEWGLASNAIHFIDIVSFISGSDKISSLICDISNPSESISKRPNFYETVGSIIGTCGDIKFTFSSEHGLGTNHIIQLEIDGGSITIDEIAREAHFLKGCSSARKRFEMPFQSNLSGALVENILLHGTCGLTPFSISAKLHLPLIKCLNDTFKKRFNLELCQLT